MNPDLLFALDLGFAMGLYAIASVLIPWGVLALLGQGPEVAKVDIMYGFGSKPLFLRKVGQTWLMLGYFPGSSIMRRTDELELYDSLYKDGEPATPQPEKPVQENQTWQDLQAQVLDTEPAAAVQRETEAPEERYNTPLMWQLLFVGVGLLVMVGCLVYAYLGTGVWEGMSRFFQLVPATLAQVFWLGDKAELITSFHAASQGAHLVAWGTAWIILYTHLTNLLNLLITPVPMRKSLREKLVWIWTLLGAFFFVRCIMLAASLTDHFWGALALYLLGGFACQFVLYWVVLYGVRALVKKAA